MYVHCHKKNYMSVVCRKEDLAGKKKIPESKIDLGKRDNIWSKEGDKSEQVPMDRISKTQQTVTTLQNLIWAAGRKGIQL